MFAIHHLLIVLVLVANIANILGVSVSQPQEENVGVRKTYDTRHKWKMIKCGGMRCCPIYTYCCEGGAYCCRVHAVMRSRSYECWG